MIGNKVICVLPAHNEGASIRKVIQEIWESWDYSLPLEIYVSEDGSSDETRNQVEALSAELPAGCLYLSEPGPRLGYSRAVQRGLGETRGSIVWFLDADGQYEPAEVNALLDEVRPGVIAVGVRSPRVDTLSRRAYSQLFGLAYRALGGPRRQDPSSPFVVAMKSDVEELVSTPWHLEFGFWWEFQWRISAKGLQVAEIPVTHLPRADGATQVYSSRRLPRIIWTHLWGLINLRRELNQTRVAPST